MRGVVSLAAALSIPLLINEGHPFPYRNLILFITFIVILVTLVFQGLTLPWVIRTVKPEDRYTLIPERKQEIIIQKKIALYSIQFLEEKYGKNRPLNEHLDNLYARLKIDLKFFDRDADEIDLEDNSMKNYQLVYLEMLQHQRQLLNRMNQKAEFDEELIRKYLSLIDLEEIKVREKFMEEDG
jgi:CPA1 family monovalent cation:H+ antiporter